MRKFENPSYGSFHEPWADFFIDLGEYIAKNFSGESRVVMLTPTEKIIPFLISIGAMKNFLNSDISTGFLPINEIWEDLQQTPLGTEVHVIDKTKGFIHYKGGLESITNETFMLKTIEQDGNAEPGWFYSLEKNIVPDIDISIVSRKEFLPPSRRQTDKGEPNLNLLGAFYTNSDPLGVLGLPNNIIQIIGNKNTLSMESNLKFLKDNASGSFADILITKNSISKQRELTFLGAAKEENLKDEVNLSIFVQGKNTNISNVLDWTNNFPQVHIIPRPSRQAYELIEIYNDEYLVRDETLEFSELTVPIGCEIMGYTI